MADSEKDNLDENNEDDNLEDKKDDGGKFDYYNYDDNEMYTMFLERRSEAPIKIDKVADYYELFVRMLKTEPKNLHTDEHFWVLGIDETGYSVCLYIVTFGYPNFFNIVPTRLFKTALHHDSVKIIIAQSRPDARKLEVTPTDIELTNAVYHKSEILGLELVDHIIISNSSIDSKTPLYCSHLEHGLISFVQTDMTYKSYKDIEPEIEKARNEYGADKFIEGEKNKAIEMAKKMLSDNEDISKIIKYTGLTVEAVKNIQKDMK